VPTALYILPNGSSLETPSLSNCQMANKEEHQMKIIKNPMLVITKMQLYFKIKKFYKIFGEAIGENFITELSDMTSNNLFDVQFDIQEIIDGYGDETDKWIRKLYAQIHKFRYHLDYPLTVNHILFKICNTKKNGFYELRKSTAPIYKFAQWLYKKGVI
jgi:hypothetical protein